MVYNLPANDNDEKKNNSAQDTINIIENLLGKKLNIKIKNQSDLLDFINNPSKYIDDVEIIEEIKRLKELVIEMSDLYNV